MNGYDKIGTVAKLTGIDVMTLHERERRHGVIVATGGDGRERPTTRDLDRLHWIRAKIDSRLSAAKHTRCSATTSKAAAPSCSPAGCGARVRAFLTSRAVPRS